MGSFIDEHRDRWPVAVMCRTIGLSERTFHAAKSRPPSARSVSDAAHAIEIRRVWTANYSCYGACRVYKQLRRQGYVIARCTVDRVMADIGLRGVQRGRRQFTTIPDDTAVRPADLVERQFWPSDRTSCGWPTSPNGLVGLVQQGVGRAAGRCPLRYH
jgi:putative transposase